MPYVKPSVATRQLGIDRRTLKKWADNGFIRYIQPGGRGQRLYDTTSVNSNHYTSKPSSISIVYGRVSTRKQLPYLRTQLATLSAKYSDHRVISDCASGLNGVASRRFYNSRLKFNFRNVHVHILRIEFAIHSHRIVRVSRPPCRLARDIVVQL